jgi:Domain of unknown function (DUF4157)
MEARFGHAFGEVRIHADSAAAGSARKMRAAAYTVGREIVFAAGRYDPRSSVGRRLLAHELAHVVQQDRGPGGESNSASLETSAQGAAAAAGEGARAIAVAGASGPTVACADDTESDAVAAAPAKQDEVEALVDRYSHAAGLYLDTDGLGAELHKLLPARSALVIKVINSVNEARQAALADAILMEASDDEIRTIGADSSGREVLLRLIAAWQTSPYGASGKQQLQMNRVIKLISPSHARLTDEPWASDPAVKGALKASGATPQSPKDSWASGPLVYDEYGVTIESMPPGLTPEAFLEEMENDLNKAVNNYVFDVVNEFKRASTAKPAQISETIHIDIKGPDNGSVMLVEKTQSRFVFQTVMTKQDGTHPEYGSREFGFQRNPDGSIMFYTRGISRTGMMPGGYAIGRHVQRWGWEHLTKGIGDTLTSRGGQGARFLRVHDTRRRLERRRR